MGINDDISDRLVRHEIGLLRLSNATIRKIVALLNRSDARISERLLRETTSTVTRRREQQLLNDIRAIVDSVYEGATGQLQIDLEALANYEVEYQINLFDDVLPIRLNFSTPSPDILAATVNSRPFQGRILKDWYRELGEGAFRRLRNTIRAGIVEGLTIDQIVSEVRGTRAQGFRDGIQGINRRAAEVTVRTAINHTATAARSALYSRNKDLIKGVQWVSVLDGRTSAICRARDGNVYDVDEGPRPPAHPNCRSTITPVVRSWQDLGIDLSNVSQATRDSFDGVAATDQTYGEWLRKQSVSVQNEVLGRRKATLFRKGELPIDRFVNRLGNELTLDELRQRERDAWKRAFA